MQSQEQHTSTSGIKTQNLSYDGKEKTLSLILGAPFLLPLSLIISLKTKMLGITFSFDRSILPKIYFLEAGIKPPFNITIKAIRSSDNAEVSNSVANTHTENYWALKMPF